jgi:CRP-like cAMP-binding protein
MTIHYIGEARASVFHEPGRNRLLSLLPETAFDRISEQLEEVTSKQRERLFRANEPITHAYFPLTAIASLVITTPEGESAEVGTVGNEGFVGVPLLLGARRSPTEAFTQVSGKYLRMPVEAFQSELGRNADFTRVMQLSAQAFFVQVAQTTACNRLHPLEQRLCRWLLMTHDRLGADDLPLTQEFLSIMLGVRRATVTIAAGMLQQAGMIRHHRGLVHVLDRDLLEQSSCECYRVVRSEYERLLGDHVRQQLGNESAIGSSEA